MSRIINYLWKTSTPSNSGIGRERKYTTDRQTVNSTEWLLPVVYFMNISFACSMATMPYEIMFGQKPRFSFDLRKSIDEQGKQLLFNKNNLFFI